MLARDSNALTAPFIGLMSGTSIDAVDAVLVRFLANDTPRLVEKHTTLMPFSLRSELLALAHPGNNEVDRTARLDSTLARLFADAVHSLLSKTGIAASRVRAIGSHGQTIRHVPSGLQPYTVQIGNPSLLAELTGIVTVADFRRRDMAAGGQGAPLAPAFHSAFFRCSSQPRVVVNIGGMANITVLPSDFSQPVSGFDTGPGNVLLDAWAERHLGVPIDKDGAWSKQGHIIDGLLKCCLSDRYFALPPPKSTGREHFNGDWLDRQLAAWGGKTEPHNIQATLVELTACSIAAAIKCYAEAVERVLVCGGGVHNRLLMNRLQNHLHPVAVESTASHQVDPDYLEAIGFAWLAKRTLEGLPGNLPEVTGARGLRILGGIYPA